MKRFFTTLIVLVFVTAAAVAGVGYYRNWFNVDTQNNNGQSEITLKVDKNKIKDDANKTVETTRQAVENAKKNAKELLNRETVKGSLTAVANDTITVTPKEGEPLTIRIVEQTILKENDRKISMSDLTSGQIVEVIYVTEEDTNVARTVTVITK